MVKLAKFLLCLRVCIAVTNYFQTKVAFPYDNFTSKGTVLDPKVTKCSEDLMGDGRCNLFNNSPECDYDGGDCCRLTCVSNCYYSDPSGSQLPTEGLPNSCFFECGVDNYFCKENVLCSQCENGTCKPMEECFAEDASVLQGINNCWKNTLAHGNEATIDYFCGKDPDFSFVHVQEDPEKHYPGCGLKKEQCTVQKCCDEVISNSVTSTNCDNTPRNFTYFDYYEGVQKQEEVSCLERFRNCFKENMVVSSGQCCECNEGWLGNFCSIPICTVDCVYGTCVAPNTCDCDEGWTGSICDEPVCEVCENGTCQEPELCECFEGWEGKGCNVPYSTPACVEGVATSPDTCLCNPGYGGRICDIPLCTNINCQNGWCVSPDKCECFPGFVTYDLRETTHCADLNCQEAFGIWCQKCNSKECLDCKQGFFLDLGTCKPCSDLNEYCLSCSKDECFECEFPYRKDIEDGELCDFRGYIEFGSKKFSGLETEESIQIEIHRIGGIYGEVSVRMTTLPLNYVYQEDIERFNSYSYKTEVINFSQGESQKLVEFIPYTHINSTEDKNELLLVLHSPSEGALLGRTQENPLEVYLWSDLGFESYSYAYLEVFDDPKIPDVELTQVTANGAEISEIPLTLREGGSVQLEVTAFSKTSRITQGGSEFIWELKKIQESPSSGCFFPSYDFSKESSLHEEGVFTDNNDGTYSAQVEVQERGRYVLEVALVLNGTQTWGKSQVSSVYFYIVNECL